jgi:pimeloyl-ACP methyl ester carboxylesterase
VKRTLPAASGEAELCVEQLGDAGDPALLLIGGAACSMDLWPDALCARLVSSGLRVVRYDHRDTGGSTVYPPGEPGYTGRDLFEDAVAVLDGLGIERAHVAGLSMGGGIAQEIGIAHRERVRSLTVMSTTFAKDSPAGLPGPSPAVAEELPEPDWNDRAAVGEYIVAGDRLFSGPGFDDDLAHAFAERMLDRCRNIRSACVNHWTIDHGESPPGAFADLAGLPALVVHGGADPLFPVEHGRAMAAALPGARYLELEEVGHQMPPRRTWDRLIGELVQLTSEG